MTAHLYRAISFVLFIFEFIFGLVSEWFKSWQQWFYRKALDCDYPVVVTKHYTCNRCGRTGLPKAKAGRNK